MVVVVDGTVGPVVDGEAVDDVETVPTRPQAAKQAAPTRATVANREARPDSRNAGNLPCLMLGGPPAAVSTRSLCHGRCPGHRRPRREGVPHLRCAGAA